MKLPRMDLFQVKLSDIFSENGILVWVQLEDDDKVHLRSIITIKDD